MAIFEEMSTIEKEELIVSLAALLCADAKVEVSKENLDLVVKASGNKIADYWTTVFGANCSGKDLMDILAAPGAGAAAAAPAASTAAAAPTEEKQEEEEEEEEEDIDMSGGGLFGDDDDDW